MISKDASPDRQSAAVMQDLPDAAILLVLTKLAVQDPLSLMLASRTCEAFRRVAADNPSVWKKAFYGAALWPSLSYSESKFNEKQSADLETVLDYMDLLDDLRSTGYKKLVEARAIRKACSLEKRQTPFREVLDTLRADVTSVLFVLRLEGSILLWGSHGPFSRLELQSLAWSGRWENHLLGTSGSSVHTLYSTEKVYQGIASASAWPLPPWDRRLLSLDFYTSYARLTGESRSRVGIGLSFWQSCPGQLQVYPKKSVKVANSMERFLFEILLEPIAFRQPRMQDVKAMTMMLNLKKFEAQQDTSAPRPASRSEKEQRDDQPLKTIIPYDMDLWLNGEAEISSPRSPPSEDQLDL